MSNPFVYLQSSRSDQPAINLTSSQLTVTTDPATGQTLASIEPSGTTLGAIQRVTADIPLATLQAATSGTPFDVIFLSAPPVGSKWRIVAAEVVVNSELLSSNEAYSAATVKVGQGGGNADAYSSAISVFGLTTGAAVSAPGTNNAPSQTGPFTLEVTLTNSTMAQLTQGDLTVNIYAALTT